MTTKQTPSLKALEWIFCQPQFQGQELSCCVMLPLCLYFSGLGNKKSNFILNVPVYVRGSYSVHICLFHCSVSKQCCPYKQFYIYCNRRKRVTHILSLSACVLLCQSDACQDMWENEACAITQFDRIHIIKLIQSVYSGCNIETCQSSNERQTTGAQAVLHCFKFQTSYCFCSYITWYMRFLHLSYTR